MTPLSVIQKIDALAEKSLAEMKRIDQTAFLIERDALHICDIRAFFTQEADKSGAKAKLVPHLREYASSQHIEPDAVCVIYQAWMAPDTTADRPSQHPDKERVLVYAAETKKGRLLGTRVIDKTVDGKVRLATMSMRTSIATGLGFGFFDAEPSQQ